MLNFNIPKEKKVRVILSTDLKNEVDDQFAMVQAILTESFDLKAVIPSHFGMEKSPHSQKDSYNEGMFILEKMGLAGKINMLNGAENAILNEQTPAVSEGAQFIIDEAMKADERPLFIAVLGALTDVSSAILMNPKICTKNVTVVWIGGGNWPSGGKEYNLKNDIAAANVLFKSNINVWQIPRNVYRMMPVSFAELYNKVRPCGEIGRYLAENVVEFNNKDVSRPSEYRILGDSPAIGVIMYEDCGTWKYKPAPEFTKDMNYIHNGKYRPIRVYDSINSRFILEDLYAKLKFFAEDIGNI